MIHLLVPESGLTFANFLTFDVFPDLLNGSEL